MYINIALFENIVLRKTIKIFLNLRFLSLNSLLSNECRPNLQKLDDRDFTIIAERGNEFRSASGDRPPRGGPRVKLYQSSFWS
jgi:hypothetical protein